MDWFVVRHPDIRGAGVVPGTALDHYRARGWLRVSEALSDGEKDQVNRASFADAPDLDAPEPEPEPEAESEPEPSAAESTEEK